VLGLDQIVDQVLALATDHVVLTGGEPMLFDAIVPLAGQLNEKAKIITIETAGTVYREIQCDLMSISPKLSGSAPAESSGWRERHEASRLNIEVLDNLTARYPYQLKFVVNPEVGNEIEEIRDLLGRLNHLKPEMPIMLMAEGRDSETLHRRERMLVPICMEHGFRLTPRLQIDLFGDTRGT
jgi:7-carboxy-7-deazaguanine synthase